MRPACCGTRTVADAFDDQMIRGEYASDNDGVWTGLADQSHLVRVRIQNDDQSRLPATQQIQVHGDAADDVRANDGAASKGDAKQIGRRIGVPAPMVLEHVGVDAQPKMQMWIAAQSAVAAESDFLTCKNLLACVYLNRGQMCV